LCEVRILVSLDWRLPSGWKSSHAATSCRRCRVPTPMTSMCDGSKVNSRRKCRRIRDGLPLASFEGLLFATERRASLVTIIGPYHGPYNIRNECRGHRTSSRSRRPKATPPRWYSTPPEGTSQHHRQINNNYIPLSNFVTMVSNFVIILDNLTSTMDNFKI
jgi:hypothetical protein